MIKVEVNGKVRMVKDVQISKYNGEELRCVYKDHQIHIATQAPSYFFASVRTPEGVDSFQAGLGGEYCRDQVKSMEDCLALCITYIL